MARPMILPNPWIPEEPYRHISNVGVTSFGNGTVVSSNNDAHYVPIILPCDVTIYSISFYAANGTGNYDLGLYDSSLARLASSGSTAMSAAGVKTLSLSDMRFLGGDLIYGALSLSNTAGTVLRPVYAVSSLEGFGWGHEASALPLPATATPVTTTGYVNIPLFAFGVR